MKRIIIVLLSLCAFEFVSEAQLITSRSFSKKERNHNVWMEFSPGAASWADGSRSGSGFINIRWTKPFGDCFAWNIFDIGGWYTPGYDAGAFIVETGPRGLLPIDDTFVPYLAANIGYAIGDAQGVTTELSLGVSTKRFTAGLYYRWLPKTEWYDNIWDVYLTCKPETIGLKVEFSF